MPSLKGVPYLGPVFLRGLGHMATGQLAFRGYLGDDPLCAFEIPPLVRLHVVDSDTLSGAHKRERTISAVHKWERAISAAQEHKCRSTESLFAEVYDSLRRIARARMRAESPSHTLQPTALVHEVYIRLQRETRELWDHPKQFHAAASEAMRRVLVEHARRRKRLKHGGGLVRVSLEDVDGVASLDPPTIIALSNALDRLEELQPVKAQVVKLRYFAGLTIQETADVLDICPATVKNHWSFSRAWLHRAIADAPPD